MDDLQRLIEKDLTQPSSAAQDDTSRPKKRKRPTAKTYKQDTAKTLVAAADTANHQFELQVKGYKAVTKSYRDAYLNFEEAVGGRVELKDILQHCPQDSPSYRALTKLFKDVDFNASTDASLDVICKRTGVGLSSLMLAFKEGTIAKITTQAIATLAAQTPIIIEQIGTDAQNRFDACPTCEGRTRVNKIDEYGEWVFADGEHATRLCYECQGTGKRFQTHDPKSREQFLEIVGILGQPRSKVPQTNVQINQMFKGDFTNDGSFEHLIRAIDVQTKPVVSIASTATPSDPATDIVVYEVDDSH